MCYFIIFRKKPLHGKYLSFFKILASSIYSATSDTLIIEEAAIVSLVMDLTEVNFEYTLGDGYF